MTTGRRRQQRDSYEYDELTHLAHELASAQRQLMVQDDVDIAALDLRESLAAIKASSQLLLDKAAHLLTPHQFEAALRIKLASEIMLSVVNDLRDISKMQVGNIDP
jgi:signal transduction histidine kinase